MAEATAQQKLETRLTRQLARTSMAYGVLAPGDRLLVGLSGGKDSYSLLHLLLLLRPRLPFWFDIEVAHVGQGQPGVDARPLAAWLAQTGVPFAMLEENTYAVVQRLTRPGETPCAVCSRLRRGILYTEAKKRGCNKLALGHHRDDSLATLLLNLFYGGKLQAMPARYRTNDGALEVIRPLIEVAEDDLRELAALAGFPIVPCALCSNQQDHQRRAVGELIASVEQRHPGVRNVMLAALKNVRPSHLLDPTVAKREPTEDADGR